jgi:hypothetical protein
MKIPKPIRREIRKFFKEQRDILPTVKERGDGKKPLQLLRKNFNKMRSVKRWRMLASKDPLLCPLRCANDDESKYKCSVTCDTCLMIEAKRKSK